MSDFVLPSGGFSGNYTSISSPHFKNNSHIILFADSWWEQKHQTCRGLKVVTVSALWRRTSLEHVHTFWKWSRNATRQNPKKQTNSTEGDDDCRLSVSPPGWLITRQQISIRSCQFLILRAWTILEWHYCTGTVNFTGDFSNFRSPEVVMWENTCWYWWSHNIGQ